MSKEIVVDVWGDFACFTQSDAKVERVTYDVPTPSACRGILSAIYCKPKEFYYEITRIEVMNPIRYINVRRNEVKKKVNEKSLEPMNVDEMHTQRGTVYLRDVYYRIYANIHRRTDLDDPRVCEDGLKRQFDSRVSHGKCFYQPYLGQKECICFFAPVDENKVPMHCSKDLGITLYDIFDIRDNTPLDTSKQHASGHIAVSYFHPYMIDGVIKVPEFESKEVFRVEEGKDV